MNSFYYYTLAPYLDEIPHRENISETDLNVSDDYRVIFSDIICGQENERDLQLERLDFIKNNPDVMNLTAHMLEEIKKISAYNSYDIECISVREAILAGKYGDYPVEFFRSRKYSRAHDVIVYYLIQKKYNSRKQDYFQCALDDVFSGGVTYYFDSVKKILYISFIAPETSENRKIYDICSYFFADLLMKTEVRWRTYPVIIGKTCHTVVGEGGQLCGTII